MSIKNRFCTSCGMLVELEQHNWTDCINELNKRIVHKDRYIAALQQTIDDQHLANNMLRAELCEQRGAHERAAHVVRDQAAELAELRELVGTHKEPKNEV